MKNKKLIALICCVLILVGAAGATLAWLTDQTQTVTNTFTASDINIELTETDADEDGKADDNSYKMVPGDTIAKDPKVTVKAGSEDCWLFIEITKSETYDTYMDAYGVRDGWTELTGYEGVYYRTVTASNADQEFYVLPEGEDDFENGFVVVKDTVTKEMMENLSNGTCDKPTLAFMAYAVQKANIDDAVTAWKEVKGL